MQLRSGLQTTVHLTGTLLLGQVLDCETRQLLQTRPSEPEYGYASMAGLPAGRIAAGTCQGIDVLAMASDCSELAPALAACELPYAAQTALVGADGFDWYAPMLWQCRAK